VALFVQSCAAPVGRWSAGWYGDRHGSARLLIPALLAVAIGTAALAWLDGPVAAAAGMGLFGLGFGVAQNATLALMFERVAKSDFGRVSALWNLAYDGGMGVGALGFGLLAAPAGPAAAFAATGVLMLAALTPALRDRRAAASPPPSADRPAKRPSSAPD
jgi:MFS family permease